MKPYISQMMKPRKYPYRVMYYDKKKNRWFVLDCFKTLKRAEGGLKRAMKTWNEEQKNG